MPGGSSSSSGGSSGSGSGIGNGNGNGFGGSIVGKLPLPIAAASATARARNFARGGGNAFSIHRMVMIAVTTFLGFSFCFVLFGPRRSDVAGEGTRRPYTDWRSLFHPSAATSLWPGSSDSEGAADGWTWGSGRVGLSIKTPFNQDDLTYTGDECDAFFPDLFSEIERSREFYTFKKRWDLDWLEETCDDGVWTHARVVIHNNRLYIKRYEKAGQSRTHAALALLHQSLVTSRERLPNVEFCIGMHDWGSKGKFSLDRREELKDNWLMPDYSYWSWPEHVGMYQDMREKVRAIDKEVGWAGKKSTLFWRGSLKVGTKDREAMLEAGRGHAWNEMSELIWGSPNPNEGPIPMEDHCRWKFHAYSEGNTYSGRLRYLQNCRVVVITHRPNYIQHYTHLLNGEWGHPDQNIVYVPLPEGYTPPKGSDNPLLQTKDRSWERLPEVMEKLLTDDAMAKRIAENQFKTFGMRYVTPATATCYWRRLLRAFGSIQQYQVKLTGNETSYETFALVGMRNGDPGLH